MICHRAHTCMKKSICHPVQWTALCTLNLELLTTAVVPSSMPKLPSEKICLLPH